MARKGPDARIRIGHFDTREISFVKNTMRPNLVDHIEILLASSFLMKRIVLACFCRSCGRRLCLQTVWGISRVRVFDPRLLSLSLRVCTIPTA